MHRSKKGTRFAKVKDVPNCFARAATATPAALRCSRAKEKLTAELESESPAATAKCNQQRPSLLLDRLFSFLSLFPHHFVSGHEIALATVLSGASNPPEMPGASNN